MASRKRQTSQRQDLGRLVIFGVIILVLLAISNDWLGARGVFDNVTDTVARWLVDRLPDGSPATPSPSPAG